MESKTIIMVVGLPCSGKTTLCKKMLKEFDKSVFIDDPTNFESIDMWVNDPLNRVLIIADLNLCMESNRDKAVERIIDAYSGNIYFKWFYFENDPAKCMVNYAYRKQTGDIRRVSNAIFQYTKLYTIPKHSTVIEIWQPNDEEISKL